MIFEQQPLNEKQKKVLLDQTISEDGPGTILRDFETLLTFIGVEGIQSKGKYRLFPMKSLDEINRKLVNPFQINMNRPQQKSYPNIHGLYLLLRSTGMLKIRKEKIKVFLVIDEKMLQRWKLLNPTEKYFTLLDAWMLRGSDEYIGEQTRRFTELPPLFKCERFIHSLNFKKHNITKNIYLMDSLRYSIGFHHLALLELFGIVSVLTDVSNKNRGWNIKSVHMTKFGGALMQLFSPIVDPLLTAVDDIRVGVGDEVSKLMPIVKPFFPEWHNAKTIHTHEYEFKDGVYIFTVTLDEVWVKISVTSTMLFEELSDAILAAFGFDHNHLYRFIYRNQFGMEKWIVHPNMEDDGEPTTTEIAIGDLLLAPGDTIIYHYDFGDDWHFEMLLEKVKPPNKKQKEPEIIERHGDPPEQYPVWEEDPWES